MKDVLLQPWTRIELHMSFIYAYTDVMLCIVCENARVNLGFFTDCLDLFSHISLALGLKTCLKAV